MGSLPQAWGRWKRVWPFWRVTGSRVHNFKGVSKKGVSISICISKGKVSTPHLVKNSTLQNHMSRHLQNVIASKVIPDPAYKLLTPAGRGPEGRTRRGLRWDLGVWECRQQNLSRFLLSSLL